jgi:Fe2+ or Zn2+ uptake regulation protein
MCFALQDAFFLGCLSSRIFKVWFDATSSTLEDRPRFIKSSCFDPVPFSDPPNALKARIRAVAEELDALRKRRQAEHPDLTLTQIYNVLEKLRRGEALDDAEDTIKDKGLVLIVKELHDQIDTLVAEAYGWPADLSDDEILARLVALNSERAAEEERGVVRWLRPDYQRARAGVAGRAEARPGEEQLEAPLVVVPDKEQKPLFPVGDVERTAAVFAALSDARGPLDAKTLARSFRQGAKAEPAIARVLASLARLGHIYTAEGRDYGLRRRA